MVLVFKNTAESFIAKNCSSVSLLSVVNKSLINS